MRFACWITKATDTHSEYIILVAFPRQQWLRERASLLRLYIHCFYYQVHPRCCRHRCSSCCYTTVTLHITHYKIHYTKMSSKKKKRAVHNTTVAHSATCCHVRTKTPCFSNTCRTVNWTCRHTVTYWQPKQPNSHHNQECHNTKCNTKAFLCRFWGALTGCFTNMLCTQLKLWFSRSTHSWIKINQRLLSTVSVNQAGFVILYIVCRNLQIVGKTYRVFLLHSISPPITDVKAISVLCTHKWFIPL
jgi:hypothetical protein